MSPPSTQRRLGSEILCTMPAPSQQASKNGHQKHRTRASTCWNCLVALGLGCSDLPRLRATRSDVILTSTRTTSADVSQFFGNFRTSSRTSFQMLPSWDLKTNCPKTSISAAQLSSQTWSPDMGQWICLGQAGNAKVLAERDIVREFMTPASVSSSTWWQS